jgi:hypothetical protein
MCTASAAQGAPARQVQDKAMHHEALHEYSMCANYITREQLKHGSGAAGNRRLPMSPV